MSRATTLKRKSALAIAVFCVFALSSCYRVESTISVENDGSGQVGYVMALNYEAFEAVEGTEGATREEFCAEASTELGELPEGATVEPYDTDGYCGMNVSFSIPASENLTATLMDITGDNIGGMEDFQFDKVSDDEWKFALSLENSELADLGLDTTSDPAEQQQQQALLETLDISYSVALPGNPGDNNADSVSTADGKTQFFWQIDPAGSLTTLEAATTPEGDGSAVATAVPDTATTQPPETQSSQPETSATETTPQTEESSDTTAVSGLEFSDDDSSAAGPIDGAADTSSTSPFVVFAGLLTGLAALGGIIFLFLRNSAKPSPAGAGMARQAESPTVNPFGPESSTQQRSINTDHAPLQTSPFGQTAKTPPRAIGIPPTAFPPSDQPNIAPPDDRRTNQFEATDIYPFDEPHSPNEDPHHP